MKKITFNKIAAAVLSAVFMLSCSGCTELEKQHFDRLFLTDVKGTGTFSKSVSIKINPEILNSAVTEIGALMPEPSIDDEDYRYGEEDYDNYDGTDDEVFDNEYFDSEYYDNDVSGDEFLRMFMDEARFALDENKQLNITLSSSGSYDIENQNSDVSLVCTLGNISMDCGNVYQRGDSFYISKKFLCTFGSLSMLDSPYMMNEYLKSVDEAMGDKNYVLMDFSDMRLPAMSATTSISHQMNENQAEIYENAAEVFGDFELGTVTEIENGTRLELNDDQYAALANRFADYVDSNSGGCLDIANNYIETTVGMSMRMYEPEYGDDAAADDSENEDSENYDDSDFYYDADEFYNAMMESMLMDEEDIKDFTASVREDADSQECKIICDNLDIGLVNDITQENGVHKSSFKINADYKGSTAICISSAEEYDRMGSAVFAEIDGNDCVDSSVFEEKLYDDHYRKYDFGLNNKYTCKKCGKTYDMVDTHYCEECGVVHDFYEYDDECGLQHGCLILNGIEVIDGKGEKA